MGDNCSARFFLLSNACVSTLMGREGEKLWSVPSEGLLLMGQKKQKQLLLGKHDSYPKSHLAGSQNGLCSAGDSPI